MASGQDLCRWNGYELIPGASAFPGLVRRNNYLVPAFDGTTQEIGYFEDRLPDNYGDGGLTVSIMTIAASATSGTYVFETAIDRNDTSHDLDADSFGANSGTGGVTTSATAGAPTFGSTTHTSGAQMDSAAAGDHIRMRVQRAPANASDTITTDVQLVSVGIRET